MIRKKQKTTNILFSLLLLFVLFFVGTAKVFPETKINNCTPECNGDYHIHKTDETSFWDSKLEFIQIEDLSQPQILSNSFGNYSISNFSFAPADSGVQCFGFNAGGENFFPSSSNITVRYNRIGTINGQPIGVDLTYKNPYHITSLFISFDFWYGGLYQGNNSSTQGSIDMELRFFYTSTPDETLVMDDQFSLMASSLSGPVDNGDGTFSDANHYEGISFKDATAKIITTRANGNIRRSKDYNYNFNVPDVFFGAGSYNYVDNKDHPNFAYNGLMFSLPNQPIWKMTFCSVSPAGRPDAFWFYFGGYGLNFKTPDNPVKTVNKQNVYVGDAITYSISQKVNNLPIDGYGKYNKFEIIDTLPAEVDYVSASISASNETLPSNAGTLTYDSSTHQVKYTFSSAYLSQMSYKGQTYTLNINCKVNEKIINPVQNSAKTLINQAELTSNVVTITPRFKITTEVENGTINPAIYNISKGENKTISYSPNPGYMIKSVTVDGVDQNISTFKNNYTFSNIGADHHIKVVYEPIPNKTLTITKIWQDWNNMYSIRPTTLNIDVKQNNVKYSTVTLTSSNAITGDSNTWRTTVSVPQYDQYRNELTYTIQEDEANENIKYFYVTPEYNQNTLTVTNRAIYVPEVNPDGLPFYKITINKNIINKENKDATISDFLALKLNKEDIYNFPITLKEMNRTVSKVNNKLVENYSGYSGRTYQGIVTNKSNLIFNNIPAGKYEILESDVQYFNFISISKLTGTTGVSFSEENGKYYITISGLTAQDEEISIKVTNQINSSRPYDEKDKENNYFKK